MPAGRRPAAAAIAALLGATLFWSGNYIVGARAVGSVDPVSLTFLRWLIAVVPLVLLAHFVERPDLRHVLRAWRWLAAMSLLGMVAYNMMLYAALEYTSALNASLINAFNPALITLAAALFLGERLTPRALLGMLMALVGVLVVLSDGDLSRLTGGGFGRGEVLMLGAITAWSAYTICTRKAPKLPPVTTVAAQAVIALIVLLPLTLATGGPELPTTPGAITALIYLGIFPSIFSYLLWNKALTVLPAASAGVFLNLVTVFTAAYTILAGDPYTAAQLIGGAIVILGVIVTNSRARR